MAFPRTSTASISTCRFRSTPCPTPCRARMSDQYRGKPGVRPHGVGQSDHDDAGSARLFLCAGCRTQARSVAVAIAARFTAPGIAARMPGGVASARREPVTRPVVEGGSRMPIRAAHIPNFLGERDRRITKPASYAGQVSVSWAISVICRSEENNGS